MYNQKKKKKEMEIELIMPMAFLSNNMHAYHK